MQLPTQIQALKNAQELKGEQNKPKADSPCTSTKQRRINGRGKAAGSTLGKGHFPQIVCYIPKPQHTQLHNLSQQYPEFPLDFQGKAFLSRMGGWHKARVSESIPIPNSCCSSSCFPPFPDHSLEDAEQGLVQGKAHRRFVLPVSATY